MNASPRADVRVGLQEFRESPALRAGVPPRPRRGASPAEIRAYLRGRRVGIALAFVPSCALGAGVGFLAACILAAFR